MTVIEYDWSLGSSPRASVLRGGSMTSVAGRPQRAQRDFGSNEVIVSWTLESNDGHALAGLLDFAVIPADWRALPIVIPLVSRKLSELILEVVSALLEFLQRHLACLEGSMESA